MWGALLHLVSTVLGSLYPGYASFKAIKNKDRDEYIRWMHYWTVYAFFSVLETLMDCFVFWLPFYYEGKLLFVIVMLLPQVKFAEYIFHTFLHPTLTQHEPVIDDVLRGTAQAARDKVQNMSIGMLSRVKDQAVDFVVQGLQVIRSVEQQASGQVKVTTDVRANERLQQTDGTVIEDSVSMQHTETIPAPSHHLAKSPAAIPSSPRTRARAAQASHKKGA